MCPAGDSQPRKSYLALDVGDVRIGVAVSESGVIAATLPAITRESRRATLDAIEDLARQYAVGTVLIGLPLLEDGTEGSQAEKSRALGRSLARRAPALRIEYWDERYSSAEARAILGKLPADPGRIDSVAAAVILQEYLNAAK